VESFYSAIDGLRVTSVASSVESDGMEYSAVASKEEEDTSASMESDDSFIERRLRFFSGGFNFSVESDDSVIDRLGATIALSVESDGMESSAVASKEEEEDNSASVGSDNLVIDKLRVTTVASSVESDGMEISAVASKEEKEDTSASVESDDSVIDRYMIAMVGHQKRNRVVERNRVYGGCVGFGDGDGSSF